MMTRGCERLHNQRHICSLKSPDAANPGARLEARRVLIALGMLLVLTGAIYWPGLSGDLVLDDETTLEPIARLARGELNWHEALFQHHSFRPLSMASYVVNWLTTGDGVWPLKLTNLVIHLLCGVLVFLLSNKLLAGPVASLGRGRPWVALWIAACWLLAPMLVSTVLYVTQRMAALTTLFSLAALLFYVHGREGIAENRACGLGLIAMGLGVFWPLAIASKENGILVPVLVVVVELFFFSGARSPETARPARGALGLSIGAAVLIGAVIVITAPSGIFAGYDYRPFTMWERVLTEWRILFDYMANLILLPGGSPFGIYHDDYPPSRGLLEPASTLLAAAAWLAVLVTGWLARGTRAGLLAFGLWFYLAAHLVESTLLPLELYFEHRNYLPSFGIFFSLGYGGYLLLSQARLKRVIAATLILVPIAYGAVTYQRVLVWQSWQRMLFAALSHYPDSPRVHTGLANLYVNQGNLDKALEHLELAAARPGVAELGLAIHAINAYCLTDRLPPPSAYEALERSPPSDDSHTVNALGWLTNAVEQQECDALDQARLAGALHDALQGADQAGPHGNTWILHTHAARLLAAVGRKGDALTHLDLASRLEPERLEAGLLAVRYRLDLDDLADAKKTILELKQRDRGRVASHSRLIDEYERRLEPVQEQKPPVQ
jgi:tetratricopeptide (TPR) repeat protein